MIDRLVCADSGNEDPTSTQGKNAVLAKKIEMKHWDYPRHLKGRLFSVVVHGDVAGVDESRNALCNWLQEMELIPSASFARMGRYIGYYGTYAESHEALDIDEAVQREVQNAAYALVMTIEAQKEKKLDSLIPELNDPRPK